MQCTIYYNMHYVVVFINLSWSPLRHWSASEMRPMTERSTRRFMEGWTRGSRRSVLTRHRWYASTSPWSRTSQWRATGPICLLLLAVVEETPRQVPGQPGFHLQQHNPQRSQAHDFYALEPASGLQAPIARAQTTDIDFDFRIRIRQQHSRLHRQRQRCRHWACSRACRTGWSSIARRRCRLPPMSTWSRGRTFRWRLARWTARSSPCFPSTPCASTCLSSRRAQCTCWPATTSMLVSAGLWFAMKVGTPSSSSSSASRCTGSTCSRGSGIKWCSAWPCQTGTAPRRATTRPWLSWSATASAATTSACRSTTRLMRPSQPAD